MKKLKSCSFSGTGNPNWIAKQPYFFKKTFFLKKKPYDRTNKNCYCLGFFIGKISCPSSLSPHRSPSPTPSTSAPTVGTPPAATFRASAAIVRWGTGAGRSAGETNGAWRTCGFMRRILRWGWVESVSWKKLG